jgi:nucleoside phosphorylase
MIARRRDIFLHFLNRDSRQIYGLFEQLKIPNHAIVLGRAINAAAILCETRCIAPPGFIVECNIAQGVMERKAAFLRERLIEFPLREESLTDLVEKKRREYASMQSSYEGLFDDNRIRFLADNAQGLIERKVAVGENIASRWRSGPDGNRHLWRPVKGLITATAVETLRIIPQRLIESGTAATWFAINRLLPSDAALAERDLRRILQHDYFSLYVREFGLVVLRNLPFMHDHFGLPSEPKIYDFNWLKTCFDQLALSLLLDASALTVLSLRRRHGFIRFIDAHAGLSAKVATLTDLRFHLDRLVRAARIPWMQFASFWKEGAAPEEYELEEKRVIEVADALGELARRIETEFSIASRTATSASPVSGRPPQRTLGQVRTTMKMDYPELAIFVALEEEFDILKKRWGLMRRFGDFEAHGYVDQFSIDVVCARNMGRVPAAVSTSFYLASREESRPALLLILGLAGGFEEEGIEEGMIIIPHTVVDLATRKIGDKHGKTTTQFRRNDFQLNQILYEYLTSADFDLPAWQQTAIEFGEWPAHRRPSFYTGMISSLDEVVGSRNWRETLLKHSPKLLGVEMEAGGVCAAAKQYNVPVAMIRAVSDKADPAKVDTQWRSRGMKTIATLAEAIQWSEVIRLLRAR